MLAGTCLIEARTPHSIFINYCCYQGHGPDQPSPAGVMRNRRSRNKTQPPVFQALSGQQRGKGLFPEMTFAC